MAKFQTQSKIFAGFSIPYTFKFNFNKQFKLSNKTNSKIKTKLNKDKDKQRIKTAILGGGDVGFPLLFAGVLLKTSTYFNAIVVSLFATLSLFFYYTLQRKINFILQCRFCQVDVFWGC